MPDFGERWKHVEKQPLDKGGQGDVYLVEDLQNPSDTCQYVAKILRGADTDPARRKRLVEEINVSRTFDHPNVVRVVDSGETKSRRYPFFVMPRYPLGSLAKYRPRLEGARQIFGFFAELCEGVAYVHSKRIIHRDLKPANIFIDQSGHPVVGDFGLCFRMHAESVTETMEVATARWFGAPELRDGHNERPPEVSDAYSLGKLLYWLFTGKVFDGHEQDYDRGDRKLVSVVDKKAPACAWADEIISQTVRYEQTHRTLLAAELAARSRNIVKKIDAHAHALDLRLPQQCMFCADGSYRPIHLLGLPMRPGGPDALPELADRRKNRNTDRVVSGKAYISLLEVAADHFNAKQEGIPLVLVCDYCGNVQHFRFDLTSDGFGGNWKP
jgi:serine/threonine protein kinase